MAILDRVVRPSRIAGLWLLTLLVSLPAAGFGQAVDEYEVKAAFLYNFTKFIEWTKMPDSDAFNICILGDDPFGVTLDQLVKGKAAYGRKIQIHRLKEAAEARHCQIVFVRREEETKAAKLVEAVRGTPVLTVGERRRFGRIGGMVYLSMQDGHVSVCINPAAAESTGLKISAKLLSLAKNFKDDTEEP